MKRFFYSDTVGCCGSLGLVVLRVVVGTAFILHGWPKIQNLTEWMGPSAQVPPAMQAVAAVAEFGGGIALVLGLFTRLASLGIMAVMIGALALVHMPRGDPFVAKPGQMSSELPAVYLACAFLLLLVGPGRYSVDAMLFEQSRSDLGETGALQG